MDKRISEELIETIYMYCYKHLCNRQDAEDLAQEILLEALKALHTHREIHSFYSWFWKMARNRYASFIALRNHQPVTLESQGPKGSHGGFHSLEHADIAAANRAGFLLCVA